MSLTLRIIGILSLCLRGLPAFAQTPAYLHYGVEEGLPGNLVYCGMQDRKGLLWFGTDKGLARFDGARFRTFDMKDGLPDPEVLNLMEDSKGRLWMSNYRRSPLYRYKGRFVTAREDTLLARMNANSALWEFFEDTDKSIWLGGQSYEMVRLTEKGIETRTYETFIFRPARIGGEFYFMGTAAIFRQKPDGKVEEVYEVVEGSRMRENPFSGMCASGNRVLYSFTDQLVLIEYRNGKFQELATRKGTTGRIFADRSGNFWVCSLAEGVLCFRRGQRDLSNPVRYLQGEKVTAMFEDRQGTYWFCTTDNGVYALPKNTAVSYTKQTGLASNNITALARNAAGNLLAGDDEGNLYESGIGDSLSRIVFGTADGYNRFRFILPAPDGGLWVVTDESICYQMGTTRRKIDIGASPKAALLQSGKLWFAASRSLGYVPEETFQPIWVANGRFTAVGEDSEGNVWAGTNEGLFSQRDGFRFDWSLRFPALRNRIVAIQNAGRGYLWIVTPGSGLLQAQVQKGQIIEIKAINERLKSPIDNIQSVFRELDGTLWLATNKGVYGLDNYWKVVHFDRHNGLANDDVNAVQVHGNTLWAATVGGLSRLLLEQPGADSSFSTFITAAKYRLNDKSYAIYLLDSLPAARKVVLPSDASLFEIDLAGLDFRSRGNLRYECRTVTRLPPWYWWTFDNLLAWAGNKFKEKTDIAQVDDNSLNFGIKMQPACYEINVTAITTAGVRSKAPDSLSVVMRPHWYATIWFWVFIWGTIGYVSWGMIRTRSQYRKLDEAVSELQLHALQAQMNPHFVGNSINAIQQFFYPPDPVRASEYIALFNRILRRTMFFSEQTFIPFSEELAYDRDYLEMVKLRFGDRFRFEIAGAEAIDPGIPFPSMLLQPVLENATLHGLAPEGVSIVKLEFSMPRKKLVCTVTDNGAGFRKVRERQMASGSKRKSKGLELLYKKIQTLNHRYGLGLKMEFKDLADTAPPGHGSRVVIQFFPAKNTRHASDEKN